MGKVCTVTFSYTFIHAIFYVLCHGWSITDQQVDRDQATNLTMVMGVIYLIYSAYFLSADFQSWTEVVNIFVAAVYLCLGVVNLRNLYSQISIVKDYLVDQGPNAAPAAFQQSVRLKYQMLRQLSVVIFIFFFNKFMLYALQGFNTADQLQHAKIITVASLVDTLNFAALLWIFRPRRQWPDYFTLTLGD